MLASEEKINLWCMASTMRERERERWKTVERKEGGKMRGAGGRQEEQGENGRSREKTERGERERGGGRRMGGREGRDEGGGGRKRGEGGGERMGRERSGLGREGEGREDLTAIPHQIARECVKGLLGLLDLFRKTFQHNLVRV